MRRNDFLWLALSVATDGDIDFYGSVVVAGSTPNHCIANQTGRCAIQSYANAPQDARSVISPALNIRELSEAENAL